LAEVTGSDVQRFDDGVEYAVYTLKQFAVVSLERFRIRALSKVTLLRGINQPKNLILKPAIGLGR
jgi:hypothetical protein